MKIKTWVIRAIVLGWLALSSVQGWSAANVYLTEVPDYDWWVACFGTATGNLMGFWDRHGLPDLYTGPTGGGVAPLNSSGANAGIVSLWVSQVGVDGRPAGQYGHYEDYYVAYENTEPDPYVLAGRAEHTPDCIGDFIGLNQRKWTNLAGECDGNIDGFCFVYWDASGEKRTNYTPKPAAGLPAIDMQSGLRAWTQYRGYDSTVFTQLTEFNSHTPAGKGFTFADLKTEIDAGYPVLLFLQKFDQTSRQVGAATRVNPVIHGMLAYGYYLDDYGRPSVRYRTSWGSSANSMHLWDAEDWERVAPVRGVIGYHPRPQIRSAARAQNKLTLQWDGPASVLYDSTQGGLRPAHGYVVEMARSLLTQDFVPVSPVVTGRSYTLTNSPSPAYYRLKLLTP